MEAIVVFGRKDRVQILEPYLQRNLRRHGGLIDLVHWVVFAAMEEDMAYLAELLSKENDYRYPAVSGRRLAKFYSVCKEPDTIYLKIDDDMVYISDEALYGNGLTYSARLRDEVHES